MENYPLKNNIERKRYEIEVEGYICYINYMKVEPDIIYLTGTEVPFRLRNRGIGKILVREALDDIKTQGFKVVPACSFITAYMLRNPQTMELLKPGIKIR